MTTYFNSLSSSRLLMDKRSAVRSCHYVIRSRSCLVRIEICSSDVRVESFCCRKQDGWLSQCILTPTWLRMDGNPGWLARVRMGSEWHSSQTRIALVHAKTTRQYVSIIVRNNSNFHYVRNRLYR